MKVPSEMRVYCAKCRTHTKHKVKTPFKGKSRPLAWGNRQHARKIMGYGGKVAGEKPVRKQGKKPRILLECSECKKKSERVLGTRIKKKLEIK